jgi:hypothetical protein
MNLKPGDILVVVSVGTPLIGVLLLVLGFTIGGWIIMGFLVIKGVTALSKGEVGKGILCLLPVIFTCAITLHFDYWNDPVKRSAYAEEHSLNTAPLTVSMTAVYCSPDDKCKGDLKSIVLQIQSDWDNNFTIK